MALSNANGKVLVGNPPGTPLPIYPVQVYPLLDGGQDRSQV